MRTFTLGLLAATALCATTTARAADLDEDFLRGSDYDAPVATPVVNWGGAYLGVHGGYTAGAFSQRNAAVSLLDRYEQTNGDGLLDSANRVLMPGSHANAGSFGAFAGFNAQFDEVVLGVEADYSHASLRTKSANTLYNNSSYIDGYSKYDGITGHSDTRVSNYGTIRGRAGYAVGAFLPFVTAGLAVAEAQVGDTIALHSYGYDSAAVVANGANPLGPQRAVGNFGYASFNPRYPHVQSTPDGGGVQTVPGTKAVVAAFNKTKLIGGAALGAGIEYAITPNVLLRAEYQYIVFQSFNGHRAELNTARGGIAVKF